MTRLRKTCAVVHLIGWFIGAPVLAQSAPNEYSDYDKCGNNNPGILFSAEVVIQACSRLLKTPNLTPILRDIALLGRSASYAQLGDDQHAIADFSVLIRLHPKNEGTLFSRALSYKRLGSYDLAIADLKRSIQLSQYNQDIKFSHLGEIYNIRKEYDRAIAEFTKGIQHEAKIAGLYEGRCFSYVMKQSYDLAISDCNQAIQMDLSPKSFELRAEIFRNKDQADLAAADLDMAGRLKAVELAKNQISRQDWRMSNSLSEKQAVRATGQVMRMTRNSAPGCAAIIISSEYVLTDGCEALLSPGFQGYTLKMALGGFKPDDGVWNDAESYFDFERAPAAKGNGWAIYKVQGDPQERYGSVTLATKPRKPGDQIFEKSSLGGVREGCRVGDWQTKVGTFVYTCGNRTRSDDCCEPKFLFSPDGMLVGVVVSRFQKDLQLIPDGYYAAADVSALVGQFEMLSVVACYRAGNATVADMHACSGVWVTGRILTLCFLEADCPVIHDTPDDRSMIDAALGGPDKLDTNISIDMLNVLSVPDRKVIDDCLSKHSGADSCVVPKMVPTSLKPLVDCAALDDDKAKALCITKQTTPNQFSSLVDCMAGKGIDASALTECSTNVPWSKVQGVQKCISETPGNAKIDCLLSGADDRQKALASCLSNSSNRAAAALDCLSASNPQMVDKIAVAKCAANAANTQAAASCFTAVMGGDAGKIAACAAGPKEKMISCLLADKPEYKAAAQAVACLRGGRDASSLVANCSDFLVKDPKTRAALACAAGAGSDAGKLVGCAASSVLPPEVARYAACATTSQGPTSFALCAAGPMINEEWRIAAECAVQAGGNPIGFAGCTAGRLTLKELTQCFTGGSCFGPNNTIVKAYTNAFRDLLEGPGANNEIVLALNKLKDATGGPNSVINNPGQLLGGQNAAIPKAVDDIINFCAHNPCPKIEIPELPKLPDLPDFKLPEISL